MKYSIARIIQNDWPSLAAGVGLPIVWGIHLSFPLLHKSSAGLPLWFPVCGSLFVLAILSWRIGRIARLFNGGRIADGEITYLGIFRDRGRLEFAFEHDGVRVSSWLPIHKTKQVLALTAGTPVKVAYDPSDPALAIVMELFAR